MNLKESKKDAGDVGHRGGFGVQKGREKWYNYITFSKLKEQENRLK